MGRGLAGISGLAGTSGLAGSRHIRARREIEDGLTATPSTDSPGVRERAHRNSDNCLTAPSRKDGTWGKRRDVGEETGRGGRDGRWGPGRPQGRPRVRGQPPAEMPPRKRDSDHALARLRRSIPATKWAEGVPRRVLPEVQGKASDEGDPGGHHDHDPPIVVGEVDLGLAPLAEEA